ncbi:hypothetical protein MMC31_004039 [Peltigera leucophlebia]|nr:hypothetical protein [Peltigera leucophlebia]
MPLPVLWQLQIERNQKIALSGVFLLGGFACISSVIRYSYVFYSNDDLTWSSYSLTVWNVIEANVTIISACLIVMKPIFVRLWPEKIVAPLRKKPSNSGFTQRSDFPLRAKYSTRLKNLPTSESAASKGLRDEFQEMERHSLDQGHRELPGGCIMVRSNINVSNEIA